jgi:type 1 fimbriae regulatory protein FimB/type 1 fimbriae regulatory protein FimE
MLRHAWGFHQANAGRDTRSLQAHLGHKNIQHTDTQSWHQRFKGLWKDLVDRWDESKPHN